MVRYKFYLLILERRLHFGTSKNKIEDQQIGMKGAYQGSQFHIRSCFGLTKRTIYFDTN